MTALERARRALFLAVSLSFLASCGGSGDDDDDEDDLPEDEDATGLWNGTFGGAPRMNVLVAPDGSFVGLIAPTTPPGNNGRVIVGTGDTMQNVINATGTTYAVGAALPNGSFAAPLTIAAGRIAERVSMTGNYLAGGETTTFSLTFQPQSTRTPSFASLAGVYSLFPVPQSGTPVVTMTVRTDGSTTFNHSGNSCVGNGSFTIIDPAWNMYRWQLSIGNCSGGIPNHTASGMAALVDSPTGGTANFLTMIGSASGAPLPWWVFNGTK